MMTRLPDAWDNRSLFSDHFLRERLPELREWGEDTDAAWKRLSALWDEHRERLPGLNEAQLEAEWVQPILRDVLGWHYTVQTPVTGVQGRTQRPDYSLFTAEAARRNAETAGDEAGFYRHAAAIAEAKFWDRPLDRKVTHEVRDITNANPSFQIVAYLVASGVPWGILTNGREWRLYSGRARSRVDTYYAVDLRQVLETGDKDAFRRWFLFFRADAFRPEPPAGQTFLDAVLEGSSTYARELERRLKDFVFREIFPHLAHGFVTWRRENNLEAESEEALREVYEGTLRLLYRLLFLLHAEARGLLPTGPYSLTRITHDAADWRDRGTPLSPVSDNFWNDLAGLFRRVDRGDPDTGMPRYNGGLFRAGGSRPVHPSGAEGGNHDFFREHRLADAFLVPALDLLARAGERSFIDYKALSVEQLGSLYEGLLEFRLRPGPDGEPVLENDKGERHATGSYYTPHYVVEYIVAETVGPVLRERVRRFRDHMKRIAETQASIRRSRSHDGKIHLQREGANLRDSAVDALLGIRLCDPAMGSGHFLVYAANWLTEQLMVVLNEFPDNPVLALITDVRLQIVENLREQGIAVDRDTLKDTHLLKRMVMKRCIYGVDLNPMATELAKLSLWLDSFTIGAPLSFLDHHLKAGNSLVGTTVRQVQHEYESGPGGQLNLGGGPFAGLMRAAVLMRDVAVRTDATAAEVAQSAAQFAEYEQAVLPFKRVLDLWTSQHFGNGRGADFVRAYGDAAVAAAGRGAAEQEPRFREAVATAHRLAREQHFFHWDLEFPEVFVDLEHASWKENPGFDAVIGNPPYVRQEQIAPLKPYLKSGYPDVYDGAADLYVFFYRQGMELLRAGGRLSYIVTNKWLRAGYGAGLRDHFARAGDVERIVDFGHAPIFPDADVFPCIVVVRKRTDQPDLAVLQTIVCPFPRERLDGTPLAQVVDELGFMAPAARFAVPGRPARANLTAVPAPAWSLERPEVEALMEKIRAAGVPLRDFLGVTPFYGVKTGLNEAFLIDTPTRDRLVRADPRSAEIIKPYLRGQDVERWSPAWAGLWMILLKSSENHIWPWTDAPKSRVESIFKDTFPALHAHLKPLEAKLRKRSDQGRYWWELRSCAYYEAFEQPKFVIQRIAFHPRIGLDSSGMYINDAAIMLPRADLWALACLNSPALWYFAFRYLPHKKDEALAMDIDKIETLPIAPPTPEIRAEAEPAVARLVPLTRERRTAEGELLGWLRAEFGVAKPGRALEGFAELAPDAFVAEVKKRRGRAAGTLSPKAVAALHATHAEYAERVRLLAGEAAALERRLATLVHRAYGLSPEEEELLWATAPPRMPVGQ